MAQDKQQEKPESMPFWRGGIKAIDDLVQNVKDSTAGEIITTPSKNAIVSVQIDKEAIKRQAEVVASWKNPYDVNIWLFAEAETRLADAYVTVLDGTSPTVQIDVSKVIDAPTREQTESLAKAIYSRRPKLTEVHWFLAERRYIYDKVKGAR